LQDHLKLLQSTNALDRWNAARALQFFGPKAAVAAPRLVEILGLPQPPSDLGPDSVADKPAALSTLKFLGANAAVVTPELVALLHTNQFVPQICDVLANIGPGAAEAIPALQGLLATNYIWVTNGSIGGFGPKAFRQEIVPRWQVAQALASINPHDSNAIAILREVQHAQHARRHLWARTDVGIEAQTRLPITITLWKLGLETNLPLDEMIAEEFLAFDRLGDIGPAAKKALPAIEKNLKDRNLSFGAALAICRIDPEEANRLGLPGLFIICPDKY
jgi:HEAT repeat protein